MLGITRPGRTGRAAAAAVVSIALFASLAVPSAAASPASDESLLLTLTNTVRAGVGVPALSLDGSLSSIARQWAAYMGSQNNISHNPNLKAQIEAAGFSDWRKTGENVGMGPTVQAIQNALVNSAGHYRNMVDGDFQKVGIGIVYANNSVWVVVDFLMTDSGGGPIPAPAPAPAPVVTEPPATAPPPPPAPPTTTTTTEPPPPPTTTTVPPTTTTLPPPPPSSLPMQLALMVQQVRALGAHK